MIDTADCLFCRIVAGEIPAEIVHRSELAVAFRDLNPQAPVHVLVVPRRHIDNAGVLEPGDAEALAGVFVAARQVAEAEGIAEQRLPARVQRGGGRLEFRAPSPPARARADGAWRGRRGERADRAPAPRCGDASRRSRPAGSLGDESQCRPPRSRSSSPETTSWWVSSGRETNCCA